MDMATSEAVCAAAIHTVAHYRPAVGMELYICCSHWVRWNNSANLRGCIVSFRPHGVAQFIVLCGPFE
jgi:hypothetical protein